LGVFYHRTNQFEKAIKKYEDALSLDPNNTLFHKNLAIAYEGLGKNEEAEKIYLTILKKDPGNDDIHNFLGVLYFRTNRIEEAIKSYLKAIELNPRSALYYQNLGFAYDNNGQYDLAEDAYFTPEQYGGSKPKGVELFKKSNSSSPSWKERTSTFGKRRCMPAQKKSRSSGSSSASRINGNTLVIDKLFKRISNDAQANCKGI